MKKKITWKDILFLQAIIVLYTGSSVAAKFASASEWLSASFLFFFFVELGVLGLYAILWQQAIKKFELSIAYASRAMAIIWSMLWAAIIFREKITAWNLVGVVLIIAGTCVLNSRESREEEQK